ncbi:MAG: glycosyltransferase [Candidatus Latescibacteria bacterium]|nr:glycosyltransferase [Candidatus Latescibacterota bacterium]
MKVCTLTHTYPRFEGDINAPFVEHLMKHIAREDVEVSVLTAYDPAWNRTAGDHTIDLRTYRYVWPERLHILGYSRTIEGNVRFRKHVLALSPLLFLGAYRAFKRLVKEKKPDVLHAHWILPNGYIAAKVSQATGVPLLIQLHGSDIFTAEKNILFRKMARFAGSLARYIISPSPDLTQRLGKLGIDTGKIGLVPNTVEANFSTDVSDADALQLRKKLGIPEGNTVVLAMGRMVYVKGFDYLLDAFRKVAGQFHGVILVLAGGGVLFDEMKALTASLGIANRVIMPGPVMRDDVPKYFKMADIFVVPSIKHESGAVDGLPVVVPEAMAAGLPIIASNVGGIPVLVWDKQNGLLVPERNPDALASAIIELISDQGKRKEYGARSRRVIESSVNYDNVSRHFVQLYAAIIDKNLSVDSFPKFDIFIK